MTGLASGTPLGCRDDTPVERAARPTTEFVQLRAEARRAVLEIGCGDGIVAAQLRDAGFDVLGVEPDPTRAARARARGVEVLERTWPTQVDVRVDLVLMSAVLHHLEDPLGALQQAKRSLTRSGMILVEDFALGDVTAEDLSWIEDHRLRMHERFGSVAGVGSPAAREEPTRGRGEWGRAHADVLHAWSTLRNLLQQVFPGGVTSRAPYLFRYLVHALPGSPEGAGHVDTLRRDEIARFGLAGRPLVGCRFAATVRDSGLDQ